MNFSAAVPAFYLATVIFLGGYIWICNNERANLRKENESLKITLESYKNDLTDAKKAFLDEQKKEKIRVITKVVKDDSSCESELNSFKALITSF